MTARTARTTMAAVALTAALVATAGCSDDGSPEARKKPASEHTETTPAPGPSARTGESGGKEKEKGGGKDGDEKIPKVPKAELTPATGSFTAKQKKYLVDRVPRGNDPAAVLQAGQAACDRIADTAEADRKAAVSALRSGEITGAEAAIEHLCPKYKPLLEAAGK